MKKLFVFIVTLSLVVSVIWAGTPIPGTVVAAKITTGNTDNTFSIGDTIEMLGTCKQVADNTARDAIPAERRAEGMQVWVIATQTAWRLVGGIANGNWQVIPALPTDAVGALTNNGAGVLGWNPSVGASSVVVPGQSISIKTNAGPAYQPNVVGTLTNNTSGLAAFVDDISTNQIPLSGVTNAGTAAYSNATAFAVLSANNVFTGGSNHFIGDAGLDGQFDVGTLVPTNITGPVFSVPMPFVGSNGAGAFGFSYNGGSLTNISASGFAAGTLVWSNRNGFIFPAGQPAPDVNGVLKGPSVFFDSVGGLFGGTNVAQDAFLFFNDTSDKIFPYIVSMTDSNEPNHSEFYFATIDSETQHRWGSIIGETWSYPATGGGESRLMLRSKATNGLREDIILDSFIDGNNGFAGAITFKTNSVNTINMTDTGDITSRSLSAGKITDSGLTPGSPVFAQGGGLLGTSNSIANGFLANSSVTVNGTANHITTTSASIALGGSATLDVGSDVPLLSANQVFTGSNFVNNTLEAVQTGATTNAWAGPTNDIDLSIERVDYVTTTPLKVTGFINKPTKFEHSVVLTVSNSTAVDKIMYLPSGLTTDDGQSSYTVTNQSLRIFSFRYNPNNYTNGVSRPFPGGSTGNAGTVTSVQAAGPTGFTWSGGPITGSGTLTASTPGIVLTNGLNTPATLAARIAFTVGKDDTGSNYQSGAWTYATNQNQIKPDFSIPCQLMSTNAAFTFLAPVGVDSTLTTMQTTAIYVTNTTAAAVLVTAPANAHTSGTMYVTNLTRFTFECYASKFTNVFAVPIF